MTKAFQSNFTNNRENKILIKSKNKNCFLPKAKIFTINNLNNNVDQKPPLFNNFSQNVNFLF